MTSVVHLTTVHSSYDTRIFLKMCRSLGEAGYRITLIAPAERSTFQQKVEVVRLRSWRVRTFRFLFGGVEGFIKAYRSGAEIVHFHDPELVPFGLLLRIFGRRVIYDAHEDVSKQVLTKDWIPHRLRPCISQVVRVLEWAAARWCDGIVAATPSIAASFPPGKAVVIGNFPIVNEISVGGDPHHRRPPNVVYLGGMTYQRGVVELVEAMGRLPRSLEARLNLVGRVRPAAMEGKIRSNGAAWGVEFHGWRNRCEVASILSQSRVGVVTFHAAPNNFEALPTKLFEYMAAGLPVVASDFPLWRSIVHGSGCGLLVDPRSSEEIASAIEWLLEHPYDAEAMGQRGRQAVLDHFNWSHEVKKLIALYKALCGKPMLQGKQIS